MDARSWMLLGALLYAASLVLAAAGLLGRPRTLPRRFIFGCMVLGLLFQSVGLHQRGLTVQSCPIGNPFEVLQFISWSIVLIYILTGPVFRTSLLGSFCAVLAGLLSVGSLLVPSWDQPYPAGALFGGDAWVEAHAAIALFSYGLFGMLAITSVMYLLQNYGLKHKRTTGLFAFLPSIVQLEIVSKRLLMLGCLFYTIAIVIGSVSWFQDWQDLSIGKLAATLLLWIAYLALLIARSKRWISAHRAAWCGAILFGAALLVLWPVEANRNATATQQTTSAF